MVAVFNKELLNWYPITLKLKETVEAGISNSQENTPTSTRLLELPEQSQQQQQPSNSLQIVSKGYDCENFEEGDDTSDAEWVISIKENLKHACQEAVAGLWAKLCIYRVPRYLREGDDKAYVPQIVSLGPYHCGRRRLRNIDFHKWRSLHHIVKCTNQDIDLYLNSMKDLEEKARACYERPISLSSNEFVEMMVLDGCFVLELFRGATEGFTRLGYCRNDPIFAMRGSMHSIQRDMIMIENQLPLFILDRLLGLQLGQPERKRLVAKLALRFFDPLTPTDEPLTVSDRNKLESSLGYDPLSDQGGLHCLDVFW